MATRSATEPTTGNDLPDAVVADILAASVCRRALELLAEREEPMIVGDIAAELVAAEKDVRPEAVAPEERRAVRDEFYEQHLPKLTATGVVCYDSMVDTVELRRPDIVDECDR